MDTTISVIKLKELNDEINKKVFCKACGAEIDLKNSPALYLTPEGQDGQIVPMMILVCQKEDCHTLRMDSLHYKVWKLKLD